MSVVVLPAYYRGVELANEESHVVQEYLLEAGTPGPVVARIIRELRELPHVDKARDDR